MSLCLSREGEKRKRWNTPYPSRTIQSNAVCSAHYSVGFINDCGLAWKQIRVPTKGGDFRRDALVA